MALQIMAFDINCGARLFCSVCYRDVGFVDWSEIAFLARMEEAVVCFDCEVAGKSGRQCDGVPRQLFYLDCESWRLVIDGVTFDCSWVDLAVGNGVVWYGVFWGMVALFRGQDGSALLSSSTYLNAKGSGTGEDRPELGGEAWR